MSGIGRIGELRDLLNLTVADAGRANAHALARPIDKGANALEVDVPPTLGNVVRVADPATELGAAPADFANLCHKTENSRAVERTSIANGTALRQPAGVRCPAALTWVILWVLSPSGRRSSVGRASDL